MATRVYLVRHGSTLLTQENRFAGETNVPLADEGRQQAHRLAMRLAKEPIIVVYASPLDRTLETARILAEPHRLDVIPQDSLREMSYGRWEGLTRAEVETRYPDEYAAWEEDPYTFAPEGGETGLTVTARALPGLLSIVKNHPDGHVLVVAHKAIIRLLLSSILGFDPRAYRDHLDQAPTALNILDFRGTTRARLTLFNDTSHYSEWGMAIPEEPQQRLSKWWDKPDESAR
ncbi:MAG: histidine phosphatase family protein [Anaerolineae bacterium]|nr:histidine phosphatase family protein [Anaerolineae bacterium]